MDIAELKQKSVAELHSLAEQLNITNYSGLRKQDLIFRIEQSLLDSDTVIRGEGVLEILPKATDSCAARTGTTSTVPTTSTSPRARSSGSTCAPAIPSSARCGRPRKASAISRCSRWSRSTSRSRRRPSTGSRSTTFGRAILMRGSGWSEDQRSLHAGGRPAVAHRQGPARPDRGPAQGGQDHPDAEARQRHQREPSGDHPHRAADRRAAGGSDRHGGERQGGGHLLHLRRARRPSRAGGRHGHRKIQAPGGARARRRDPPRLDHPPRTRAQRGRPALRQDSLRRRRRQRAAETEAVLRRRAQHRRGRQSHHHRHRADRHRAAEWTR